MSNKSVSDFSVYVAGGWAFRDQLRAVMDKLRSKPGIAVVSGWIERENGITTPEVRSDIDEVKSADLLLAIMEDENYAYRGTFTEIGCALALDKPVVVLCPGRALLKSDGNFAYTHHCQTNVFFWHPQIERVQTLEEAIGAIDCWRA